MAQWQVPGYEPIGELGRGGGGRVVAAVQRSTGERVAVKVAVPARTPNARDGLLHLMELVLTRTATG
jgi:hypothetical protein